MASRPTITDLAKAAGVSVATVDRVLNGRHKVREETARRVYDAANTIGYHAIGLIRQRVFEDLPQYRLGFSFQRPGQAFYQNFAREIEIACNACTTARIVPQVDFISAPGASEPNVFRTGGPIALVTNRCVFAFANGRFRLESVHPGHTIEEVLDNTGFDFDRPPTVPETPAPAAETLQLMREVVAPQLAEIYPQFARQVFGNGAFAA